MLDKERRKEESGAELKKAPSFREHKGRWSMGIYEGGKRERR